MTHLFPGPPWRAGWGVLLRSLGSSPGPAGCASSGGRVGPVGLLGHMARPAAVRVPGLRCGADLGEKAVCGLTLGGPEGPEPRGSFL